MNAAVLTRGEADAKCMGLDHSGVLWMGKGLKCVRKPERLRLQDGDLLIRQAIDAKPWLTQRRRGVKQAGNGGKNGCDGGMLIKNSGALDRETVIGTAAVRAWQSGDLSSSRNADRFATAAGRRPNLRQARA